MAEKPTLVIGDVHGHYDRLEALLVQEGIIGPCPDCEGVGQLTDESRAPDCKTCNGDGQRRINHDVRVIQLGDLGHFGADASPTGDMMCYRYADDWFDDVLWGNHDRAVVDSTHTFGGYMEPGVHTKGYMTHLWREGKLKMATCAHGYLIVHAGIHLGWKDKINGSSAHGFAERLNRLDEKKLLHTKDVRPLDYADQREYRKRFAILDAISPFRGGRSQIGGVLWMDWKKEKHLQGAPFKFICGHTADRDGLVRDDEYGNWNIDVGGKNEARLAGLWLTDDDAPRIARIDL